MSNDLPMGYITCLQCGRPALWLLQYTEHSPLDSGMVKVGLQYELVNIDFIYDPDIAMCFFCDSCHREVSDDNMAAQYITFIKELTTKKQ